jgi:hypothetical protein
MAAGGFCKSLGLWRSDAPSKHIAVTTTSVVMIGALGLVVVGPQRANYYHYGAVFFRYFLF